MSRYKPYPAYKESGVESIGKVPKHWKVLRLANIGRLIKGNGGTKADDADEGMPCIRYGDLYTTYDFCIKEIVKFVRPESAPAYSQIQYGDVVLAASGETFEEIGKSSVNLDERPAVCGGDVIILRPARKVDPTYLGYAVGSASAQAQKSLMGKGFTVIHVYGESLRNLIIASPPDDEQQRIALVLSRETSRIDALLSKKTRFIELLEEKRQALITHAVTKGRDPNVKMKDSGVTWLEEMPEHWKVKRLRHVASLNPEPDWKALAHQQGEYPFLPMEAIGEAGEIDASRRKSLEECRSGYTYFSDGDVAYAKVTPCFENGKGALIRGLDGGHGFGTTELTVLRPTEISGHFLYALTRAQCFRQPGASEMLGAGGLKRVPEDFARNYRAGIPPAAEQAAITATLNRQTARIDALITAVQHSINLLKEHRSAFITAAVTGQIDLREAS